MSSNSEHDGTPDVKSGRELHLLHEVQRHPEATQRELSKRVGIALGMTNLLLQRLTQKGYVRMTQAGWRRWLYALTPEGLSRKLQLTVAFVNRFVQHYREVRLILRDELALGDLNAESTVAIYGTGELAEMAYLGLKDLGIEDMEVYDNEPSNGTKFLGMKVRDISTFRAEVYDGVIVVNPNMTSEKYTKLRELGVPEEKLVLILPSWDLERNSGVGVDKFQSNGEDGGA